MTTYWIVFCRVCWLDEHNKNWEKTAFAYWKTDAEDPRALNTFEIWETPGFKESALAEWDVPDTARVIIDKMYQLASPDPFIPSLFSERSSLKH